MIKSWRLPIPISSAGGNKINTCVLMYNCNLTRQSHHDHQSAVFQKNEKKKIHNKSVLRWQASFCWQHQLNKPKINDNNQKNYSGQFSAHHIILTWMRWRLSWGFTIITQLTKHHILSHGSDLHTYILTMLSIRIPPSDKEIFASIRQRCG